jgi:uncharacterized membrane protein YgdD (TMEM256/DUF423 family)
MRLAAERWGVVAGLSGFMAIVMGAVGVHAVADAHMAALVDTASLYEPIHVAFLLWLSSALGNMCWRRAGCSWQEQRYFAERYI